MSDQGKTSPKADESEQEFHRTAQRNAIGGYIGCSGPECWELIQRISRRNTGHKIQDA